MAGRVAKPCVESLVCLRASLPNKNVGASAGRATPQACAAWGCPELGLESNFWDHGSLGTLPTASAPSCRSAAPPASAENTGPREDSLGSRTQPGGTVPRGHGPTRPGLMSFHTGAQLYHK